MRRSLDDIFFTIARTASGSGVVKTFANFDPASILKGVGRGNFFKNLNLPEIKLSSSKLFHTPDVLSNLKNVDMDDLIPKRSAELIETLGKQSDELASSLTDDLTTAFVKSDVEDIVDPDVMLEIMDETSLKALKNTTDEIASKTAKNLDEVIGEAGEHTAKNIDEIVELPGSSVKKSQFKNTDEMADALKQPSGYKNADEVVGDGLEAGAKKKSNFFWDDVAEEVVRNDKWGKLTKYLDAHGGKINLGIFAAFMLSRHINGNAPWSSKEVEEELGDPIEIGEIEEIKYSVDVEEIVRNYVPEAEAEAVGSDVLVSLVVVVAATLAFMSL